MKRKTFIDNDGFYIDGINGKVWSDIRGRFRGRAIDRLASYEDTGLEPDEITDFLPTLKEWRQNMGALRHVHELVTAEAEGRLVVLPCKVGDTVYRITHDYCDLRGLDKCDSYCDGWDQSCDMNGGGLFVEKGQFTFADLDEIGKNVFRTREEAEAALKGAQP